jgi:ABC-type branched-subunit amino acid transport system ATPase component/branched-subunit amino acid ABC-type transport system permease component
LLPFIIIGVVSGSVYGMAAVGLVLTYRTSGIFNFAHGALATLAAYVFYALYVGHGVPWPLAGAVAVLILSPALGITFERFARVLSQASLIMQIVGTVGVLLVVEAFCTQWYGSNASLYPQFLPSGQVAIASTYVTVSQLIVVAISVVATAALYILLRASRLGRAMRAVVDDPDLLAISGTSPVRVRRAAWVIGSFLVTLSGLLLAPSVGLDATALTLLVVQAFGAAAIGRFRSLPLTWLGGLVIGIAASITTSYVSTTSILGGLPTALPFIILFVVLLLTRTRRRTEAARPVRRHQVAAPPSPRLQIGGGIVAIAFLALVPWLFPAYLTSWMVVLTDVMLFLSIGLLVRASQQVSLCQIAFAAIGAVAFSRLTSAGVPWLPALAIAGLVVVPIGLLLAVPAVRLSGLYLALATFGFGLLLQAMFYQSWLMFGLENLGLSMPRPSLPWLPVSSDRGFYFVLLVFTAATAAGTGWLLRGRLGALLRVLGESPVTLESFGVNVTVTRILVFCLSAFIAAVAGALSGVALGSVTAANFDPNTSLTLLVVVVISVGGEPWYAVGGALAVGLLPAYFTSQTALDVLQFLFGLGAIIFSLGAVPRVPSRIAALLPGAGHRARPPAGPAGPARLRASARPAGPGGAGRAYQAPAVVGELAADGVTVRFGGLVAVDGVSVTARRGRITGVIGPNGAGKTTLFDACSGLNSLSSGHVLLGDQDVSRRRPSVRARLGLGRTFQQVQLCEPLTVEENVRIGSEAGMVGASAFRHVFRSQPQRRNTDARSAEAMELCGISALASRRVEALPTGQRRLVELARCLAGNFSILLLDEPSSGLDQGETQAFGQLLRRAVTERAVGILLIEHDLSLTMGICDDLYVLDFGKLIYQGTPAAARESSQVRTAYLGDVVPG